MCANLGDMHGRGGEGGEQNETPTRHVILKKLWLQKKMTRTIKSKEEPAAQNLEQSVLLCYRDENNGYKRDSFIYVSLGLLYVFVVSSERELGVVEVWLWTQH